MYSTFQCLSSGLTQFKYKYEQTRVFIKPGVNIIFLICILPYNRKLINRENKKKIKLLWLKTQRRLNLVAELSEQTVFTKNFRSVVFHCVYYFLFVYY